MNYSSSNLLGMVQAISAQTARNTSTSPNISVCPLHGWQRSAQARQLLFESPGRRRICGSSCRVLLNRFDAARFQIDGPDVTVPPYLVTCSALLFHELATDTTKYGALSWPQQISHRNRNSPKLRSRLHDRASSNHIVRDTGRLWSRLSQDSISDLDTERRQCAGCGDGVLLHRQLCIARARRSGILHRLHAGAVPTMPLDAKRPGAGSRTERCRDSSWTPIHG